jgi:hypothetical protein
MQIEPPPPPPIIVRRKDPKLIGAIGVLVVIIVMMGVYMMTLPFAPASMITSDDDVLLLAGNITETLSEINSTLSFLEDTLT